MNNKTKAVLLILLSAFAFSIMQAFLKLSGDVPVVEKVFFRNLVSCFIAFIMVKKAKLPLFGSKPNRGFLLTRSLLGVTGMALYFYAIGNMNLADSSLLNKLSPFFVTIFAFFFLKEKISKVQVWAMAVVFMSSMLVIKPKFDLSVLPALAGFSSAIFAGAAYTLVRYLGKLEKPATIVFFFSLVSTVVMIPFIMINPVMPSVTQLLLLLGTGVLAAVGQFTLTYAYRMAPASDIAIYNYTNIVFAGWWGFLIWQEIPDWLSITGAVIIVGTSLGLFIHQHRSSRLAS